MDLVKFKRTSKAAGIFSKIIRFPAACFLH